MEPSSEAGTEPVLAEAYYTVVLADGHRTLEVTRAGPDFRAGSFIASYLSGPDNESGHRAFGHIATAGDGRLWHASGRARPSPTPWWPIPRQRAGDGGAGLSSMRPAERSMRRCTDV
jgi:hypothetical protein